jgi:hypothetical protein
MDRFINKKRNLDNDNECSVDGISSGSITRITVRVTSNTMKTICPSDSLYLEKSRDVPRV